MERAPHYVRVARALALLTTLGTAGCYAAHERPEDAGPIDAYRADVPDAGPCARPLPCTCPTLARDGTCTGEYAMCCPVTGPLAPPELPV